MKTYKHKTNGSTMTYKDGCMKIENLVIEGTPNLDYWEEIVKKNYEILKMKNTAGNLYDTIENETVFAYLESGHSIYSVKRLSDGEIFTIGDKVRISKLQSEGSFIIDEFYFDSNNDELLCNGKCTGNGHVSITKIEKVKQPLFTTEDGVDIYEGDDYYYFRFHSWTLDNAKASRVFYSNDKLSKNSLYFSTKEKAEEYILMNKPCLSLNDVFSIYPKFKKILV